MPIRDSGTCHRQDSPQADVLCERADRQCLSPGNSTGERLRIGVVILLVFICLAIPLVFAASTFGAGRIKLVVLHLPLLAIIWLWFCGFLGGHLRMPPMSPAITAVVAFFGVQVVSALFSRYPHQSVSELWRQGFYMLIFFVVTTYVTTKRSLLALVAAQMVTALFVCAYGLVQRAGMDPFFWSTGTGYKRVFSTVGNANMLAGYLLLLLPLGVAFTLASRGMMAKVVAAAWVLFVFVCLVLTGCRGALLGIPASATVFAAAWLRSRGRRPRRKVLFAVAALLVCMGGIAATGAYLSGLGGRFSVARVAKSATGRWEVWRGASRMFLARPFCGHGVGTFQLSFPEFRRQDFRKYMPYNTLHAHSEYLEQLAELGFAGPIVFLLFIALLFRESSVPRAGPPLVVAVRAACATGMAGLLAHMLVSVNFRWIVCPTTFWMLAGMCVAPVGVGTNSSAASVTAGVRIPKWTRRVCLTVCLVALGITARHLVLRPYSAQVHLHRGCQLLERGDFASAIWSLKQAIRSDRLEYRAYYSLGRAYFETHDYPAALHAYQRLTELAPNYCQVHYNLGSVHASLGHWSEAANEFRIAAEMGTLPKGQSLNGLLASLGSSSMSADEKRLAVLTDMVAANPDDKVSWNRIGLHHYYRKHYAAAEGACRNALKTDPAFIPALHNLGGIMFAQERYDETAKICRRIVQIDPEALKARINLGRALSHMGKRDEAEEHWRHVLKLSPGDKEAQACIEALMKPARKPDG